MIEINNHEIGCVGGCLTCLTYVVVCSILTIVAIKTIIEFAQWLI